MSVSEYHARDWAEGKSKAEILAEAERARTKMLTHHYQWNEVGSAHWDYVREQTLLAIASEMT